jgi:hypothetical protein
MGAQPKEFPVSGTDGGVKTVDERKRLLSNAVQSEVIQGSRVQSQTDFQCVLVKGKPVNHTLHLILTIVTCSAWGLVWLILWLTGGEKRLVVSVDEYGNVLRQQL